MYTPTILLTRLCPLLSGPTVTAGADCHKYSVCCNSPLSYLPPLNYPNFNSRHHYPKTQLQKYYVFTLELPWLPSNSRMLKQILSLSAGSSPPSSPDPFGSVPGGWPLGEHTWEPLSSAFLLGLTKGKYQDFDRGVGKERATLSFPARIWYWKWLHFPISGFSSFQVFLPWLLLVPVAGNFSCLCRPTCDNNFPHSTLQFYPLVFLDRTLTNIELF